MIRSLLFRLSVFPLVILIAVALLIGTPWGTRLVVLGLDSALPMLSLKHKAGALTQRLELEHFELNLAAVTVRLQQAQIELEPTCLLNKTLCADSLVASGVEVIVPLHSSGSESEQLDPAPLVEPAIELADNEYSGIALPFNIDIRLADLSDVTVTVKQMTIATERLQTELTLSPQRLWLGPSSIENFVYRLPISEEGQQEQSPNNEDAGATLTNGPLANLVDIDLPFAIDVEDLTVNSGLVEIGTLTQQINYLAFAGFWHHQYLQLSDFELQHEWADLVGSLSLEFVAGYPIEAAVNGTINTLPWLSQLTGLGVEAQLSNSLQQLQVASKITGKWQTYIQAGVDLTRSDFPFDGQLSASSLQWPIQQSPQFIGKDVVARFNGDLNQQQFSGSGAVTVNNYPESNFVVSGGHQNGQITLKHAEVEGGIGNATGRGVIAIDDGYRWDLGLTTSELDLAKIIPSLPLYLDGSASSKGHYSDQQDWHVEMDNSALNGHWKQLPLNISGAVKLDSQWRGEAKQLQINLNDTELYLDGGLTDQQWTVNGHLHVTELNKWIPDLHGTVDSDLTVSGTPEHPKLTISAGSSQIEYQQFVANNSAVKLTYLARDNHQFEAKLSLGKLIQGKVDVGALTVNTAGNLDRQQADVTLSGDTSLKLALGGNLYLEEKRWRGGLFNAELAKDEWAVWLNHVADINLDLERVEAIVGQHCWISIASKLCSKGPSLIGKRGAMAWDADANLGRLIGPVLPPRLSLDTKLRGEVALNWSPEQAPAVFANLNGNDGQVLLERGLGLDDSAISWRQSETSMTLRQQQLNVATRFKVDDQQSMELSLDVITEDDYPLSGSFSANSLDLAPFFAWVKQLSDGEMLLDGDLAIGGTALAPEIIGDLQFKQGSIKAVANPTELTNIEAAVTFNGSQASFTGTSNVGNGYADFSGKLYWLQGFAVEAKINGSKLDLLYPPIVQLQSSGRLYLIWTPQLFSLTGDVDIDSGNFQVQTLPKGTVQISDDVVFIDDFDEQTQNQSQRSTMDIKVSIADQVSVEALGVSGIIGGDLVVQRLPTQPIQIYGSLALSNGEFEAYGQALVINRGQVVFNGPPTLPSLDVEATRELDSEDLTVGVRLTGVPKSPKLSLFANRAMEQQEILSYLIRGQGLSSDGQSSLWATAALSIGVGTTGGVVSTIGEQIGFKNVKLDAEGSGDETQVTVSGYIGDKLYLKYGVDVFGEGLDELTVRYYLAQRLWLEAVNSVSEEENEASLDIYYQFEID